MIRRCVWNAIIESWLFPMLSYILFEIKIRRLKNYRSAISSINTESIPQPSTTPLKTTAQLSATIKISIVPASQPACPLHRSFMSKTTRLLSESMGLFAAGFFSYGGMVIWGGDRDKGDSISYRITSKYDKS
jgi:hypothetical protein